MLNIKQFKKINILITQKKDGNFRKKGDLIKFLKSQNINKKIQHLFLVNGAKRIFSQNFAQTDHHADAIIADFKQNRNLCLSFVTGDCFPLIAYDQKTESIALIHAGWMPLVQNIIELTILDMHSNFNSNIKDMVFWIGPGIHQCCYTSSHPPCQHKMPEWQKVINKQKKTVKDEWTIDLNQFIRNEIVRLGGSTNNISDIKECSCCCRDENGEFKYFSYKRGETKAEKANRFITAVWIN